MYNNHQVNENYGQSERNRRLAKDRENKRNFFLGILMVTIPFLVFLMLAFLVPKKAIAADSLVNITQVGSNNVINIEQYNAAHNASINLGASSAVDNTNISIVQRDTGVKTATVEIRSGINNGVNILQQGAGTHNSSIQNLSGSGNNINIDQNGAGNHEFNIVTGTGTINSGNTINATQAGGAGADKSFQVNLNGATGAAVTVQQTNPTQANQGSMNIQCSAGCGAWSYIRN